MIPLGSPATRSSRWGQMGPSCQVSAPGDQAPSAQPCPSFVPLDARCWKLEAWEAGAPESRSIPVVAGRIGKPRLDSFPGEVGSLHYIRLSFLPPPKQTLSERLLPQHTLNKSLSSGASGPQWGLSWDQARGPHRSINATACSPPYWLCEVQKATPSTQLSSPPWPLGVKSH